MPRSVDSRNLLDLRPVRLVGHEIAGDHAVVLVPRFRSRWMGWLQRRLSNPHFKLHLDDMGTAVWLSCDGAHTVQDIGRKLQERFGESIEPIWDRLAMFIRRMTAGKLIELRN